jgi:bifunctional DNA-binding transcriptional regulator/antitoxin component of YhaV-PrlF toxin-antitoxin module
MYGTESMVMERKIINVTGKRQVTIPLKFYEKLRFGKEVECFLADDAVVIRPLSARDDSFTMEILKDLVSQGYSGDELLTKFAEQRSNIKKAIGVLIDEADEIAGGERKGATTKDIFGEE